MNSMVRARLTGILLFLGLALGLTQTSAQEACSRVWSASELFAAGTSSHAVLESGAITLEKNILVEDDAPGCGYSPNTSSVEILKEGIVLKKTLAIDRVPSGMAYLVALFYPDNPPEPNNGRHILFTVNGNDIPWELKHFWTRAPVPAEYLKKGENEILVRVVEPDTRFKTWIALDENFRVGSTTRLHHPNRSARSTDNGLTWDDAHLGVNGKADGEYSIRLNLESYQPDGWVESPVVDLAQESTADAIQLPVHIERVNLEMQQEVPEGTSAFLEVRTGPAFLPESGGWSSWTSFNGTMTKEEIRGRFLQFRLKLASTLPDQTPTVSRAEVRSTFTVEPDYDLSDYFSVVTKRYPVIRSSFPFEYENPRLNALKSFRSSMKLDALLKGADTEFGKMLRLKGWVARQWDWHLLRPEQDIGVWDANRIMKPGADGKVEGGFCLHYAIVLMQALQSYGFPARIVSVDYSVWGGHEVVEAWSNQYGKWIFLDGDFDTYFADRTTGIPLNVLEMHNLFVKACYGGSAIDRDSWSRSDLVDRAAAAKDAIPVVGVLGGNANSGKLTTYEWWNPPVDLSAYCGGYGPLVMGYLRYLPRANYLSKPTPIPVNHGRTHWGWTGYNCWYDAQTPRSLEHSTFTNRSADLYWNLNQIDFRALVVKSGVLRITMATNSPDLKEYEVTINGSVTRTQKPTFDVQLARGPNKVEMNIIDSMGNKGSVSSLECTYIPKKEQE